jgi:hypothetical protein
MISASKFAFSQVARHHHQVQMTKATAVTIGEMVATTNNTRRSFHSHTSPAVRRYQKTQKQTKTGNQPTMEMAQAMATDYPKMDNQSLITIAAMDNHEARCEVLKRHIMTVDKVSYDKACSTFTIIATENRKGMALAALPYQIGVTAASVAAFASIPMVFDLGTAEWFNLHYVTTETPEPADLETMMEVGSWTWNWMEPPLGTFSFFLLCLQFSRYVLYNNNNNRDHQQQHALIVSLVVILLDCTRGGMPCMFILDF